MAHATHAEAKNYRNVNEMANTLADSKRSALMPLPGIPYVQMSVGDFSHFWTGPHCSYLVIVLNLFAHRDMNGRCRINQTQP
jgi:hypothetical protein